MNKNKSKDVATLAIFLTIMIVIEIVSQLVFANFILPIKPTITHIPVIIASILYGPRLGAQLGGFMGIMSIVRNSIIISPLSYVFSPFVENGNLYSVLIALVPRILIGVIPYLAYKLLTNKTGLLVAGLAGTLTNTIFVLTGIFVFFSSVYGGDIKILLTSIVSFNSIAELTISGLLTLTIVPILQKVKNKY
ncbi:ECF transporter S component [Streptococcus ruminantium]|uniref:ECF transporter S component n=1 Tax=Streptococcus ruminantium TaxID=1917441 RepID=A0ABU1B4E5_9STRE|nr:ECF transporter S component [Streptococcus ruminantium]MDQ8758535.1 ECF transporter S component [Streptococcus ruminantium]MDQ8765062.1 ECF transporter S component [Streptococcus ruminantium]MDQ8768105.1 ECF transporter S component [Streptococcus ruminantium]MDQ8773998.1 ECF transporter S component [Streptococcus ruminantium]MDQ8780995.1 ECF transporter S component [Streptococcus ruminantium]